jgi:5-deoxy-glucuronate isomerase
MSELLVRPSEDGSTRVEMAYVGFEVLRLGGTETRDTGGRELCVVLVEGECRVNDWDLAGREDPWSGPPGAAYLPPGTAVELSGRGEVALCWAPANGGGAAARMLPAGEVEHRGRGAHARQVRPILMGDQEAGSLLVCEVITPAGHWSSYPPHKHDRDAMPEESFLEETYYHRVSPARGFALQRVYTGDGELDESVAVSDRDTVLVPRGYHTVSAPPGYELYYLNVMAGPTRAWAIQNDPDHEWTI